MIEKYYGEFSETCLRTVLRKYLDKQPRDTIVVDDTGIYKSFVLLGFDTRGKDSYAMKSYIGAFLLGTFERSGGVVFPFRDGRKRKITGHLYKIF